VVGKEACTIVRDGRTQVREGGYFLCLCVGGGSQADTGERKGGGEESYTSLLGVTGAHR
jgi:hypothetical protein